MIRDRLALYCEHCNHMTFYKIKFLLCCDALLNEPIQKLRFIVSPGGRLRPDLFSANLHSHFRSRSKRVRFVHSSLLPLQKRMRVFPESLRRGRGIGPQIDTGPEDGFDSSTSPESSGNNRRLKMKS
jgi:hypothetical protein